MASLELMTVCTGNICRSPVAERSLGLHLRERGVDVSVHSMGTHGGIGNDPQMLRVAAEAGFDLRDHRSRSLAVAELKQTELIVAMDRGHVERVVAVVPEVWRRTFTLAELVRRAGRLEGHPAATSFDDWLFALGRDRTAADVINAPATDDIVDPYGASARTYRSVVARIDELSASLAEMLTHQVIPFGAAR